MGHPVIVYLPLSILPDEVGHLGEVASLGKDVEKLDGGHLGGIPAHHQVDLGPVDEFVVEVRGGKPSELHLRVGMVFLDDLRQFDGAVGVGHPMEVDAVYVCVDALDLLLGIEFLVCQHLSRDVDDTGLVPGRYEMGRDGHEPYGIHLENR